MHETSSRGWNGKIMLINQEVQGGGRHERGGHVGEREEGFFKNDMSRDEDAI
jgi:hypothetical protein